MSSIQSRWSHASTLINTTIYITGGSSRDSLGKVTILDDTIALDLTQPWSIDSPLFTTLPTRLSAPLSGHSMNRIQGTTQLLVVGGQSTTNLTQSPILLLETNSNSSNSSSSNSNSPNRWSSLLPPPAITNTTAPAPFHRMYHAAISTGKDGVLVQGGYETTTARTINGTTVVSSLVTFKPTVNNTNPHSPPYLVPRIGAPVSLARNAPAVARHTMTLTPDGRAILLGGINSQGLLANLSQAYVLDTQADAGAAEWKTVTLSGKPPDPRVAFSTVMVNVTTILVYGGTSDFKSAFWATFYLDLPTWTWSSPTAQGVIPRRWGHTATMAGNIMVVAFGLSSHQTPDNTAIVLLDTMTNTWITRFRPEAMNPIDGNANNNNNNDSNGDGDSSKGNKGGLSVGAVLGLGFVFTLAIVGGVFWLLVRRRKRRTRNTMARENMDQYTTSRAAAEASSRKHFRSGFLELLGVGAIAKRERGDGEHKRPDSKRYSEFSLRSHHPQSIMERMAELGYSPMNLGYPEQVVRQGTGSVPISSYAYPNQACAHTERWRGGKHETQIVFHDMTAAQKEALRLAMEEEYHRQQPPKHELLQFDDDGFF